MTAWNGLGLCLFPDYVLDANLALWYTYFKSIGITKVRIVYDWLGADLVTSKTKALAAKAAGMNVVWGITQNSQVLTASNWSTYATAVTSAATWAQANGIDEFQIGNELEYHNDNSTLTDDQLIGNLVTLSASVAAIFTGPTSYASGHDDFLRAFWVAHGIGSLTWIASNIYKKNGSSNGLVEMAAWMASFPSNFYLSEWALDATSIPDYATDWDVLENDTRQMQAYIQRLGIPKAYFFCWNDNFAPNAPFGIVNSCNDPVAPSQLFQFRQMWNPLATNNGRSFFKSY